MTTKSLTSLKRFLSGLTKNSRLSLTRLKLKTKANVSFPVSNEAASKPQANDMPNLPSKNQLALAPLETANTIHPACTTSTLEDQLLLDQHTVAVTQWSLDDNHEHNEKNKKITVVEVEFFPTDPYSANAAHPKRSVSPNYTIEGEDPNQRITHYPPSDRLH